MEITRSDHMDLLADHLIARLDSLCGGAVREAFEHEVLEACGIEPNAIDADGGKRFEWAKHLYAKGLLDDVLDHMATRWGRFRETEKLTRSAAVATDDEGDFD